MKTTWTSEYVSPDGRVWAGPDFEADTLAEAQALALEYPLQPLTIVGQLVAIIPLDDDASDADHGQVH